MDYGVLNELFKFLSLFHFTCVYEDEAVFTCHSPRRLQLFKDPRTSVVWSYCQPLKYV